MNSVEEIMTELAKLGSEQTRRTFARHGAPPQMFGVKVGDLKTIAKKIRGNQSLAMGLYATGNSDAMYLAGLVADGQKMTKPQLESWAKNATWYMLSEYTVPWVASENSGGRELRAEMDRVQDSQDSRQRLDHVRSVVVDATRLGTRHARD